MQLAATPGNILVYALALEKFTPSEKRQENSVKTIVGLEFPRMWKNKMTLTLEKNVELLCILPLWTGIEKNKIFASLYASVFFFFNTIVM